MFGSVYNKNHATWMIVSKLIWYDFVCQRYASERSCHVGFIGIGLLGLRFTVLFELSADIARKCSIQVACFLDHLGNSVERIFSAPDIQNV